ncbi:unnamed protein product [Candida verbasci]|uniref:Alpha-1,3-mannosyltransferase n=1 Tax=Candida verbasci TaxID=1227364 RepID=A0A9W4TY95_9ASCO|nr:unnamed protein product [Candida verbasci]
MDQNWIFNPNEAFYIDYYSKDFEVYFHRYYDELKSKIGPQNLKETISEYEIRLINYAKKEYREYAVYQKLINQLTIARTFNKCYLNDDNERLKVDFLNKQKQFENKTAFEYTPHEYLIDVNDGFDFEHRVYPWLSFEMPIFERWTGESFYKPPNMRKLLNDKNQPPPKSKSESKSFLKNFKNSCNGKGIVLSIADKHVDHTVNLIHLLRALNNRLPIQIIYHNDVSTSTKSKLVTAAREDFSHLPQSFYKIQDKFPQDYLHPKSNGLPKQELWFINTANTIHENYKFKFRGFSNKILASLFNSFSEFILIDADTVMMQNPEFFFNLQGYKDTGTYFFKDRAVLQKRSANDGEFFKNMGPSVIDNLMFNIPLMTNYTIQRELFKGLTHYMESGLVVLNKDSHFSSILMMQKINFFPPISGKLYGDKEIFWLGFAINGDENYYFNQFNAASIGTITNDKERIKENGELPKSKELCSPHPGHINGEDGVTLLWMNSGFRYCHQSDQINFNKEITFKRRLKFLSTIDQFKSFYYNPLRIKQAIIPPFPSDLRARNNDEYEPSLGWSMDHEYCARYLWCAYSSIGGKFKYSKNDNLINGRFIEFSEFEQDLFNYYGDIWVGLE